jgi:flagellar P-ring protein precursor FlgI
MLRLRPPARLYWYRLMLLSAGTLAAGGLLTTPSGAAADEPSQSAAPSDQDTNVVIGVGLVIGLPGTGDAAIDHTFVDSSIVGVLKRAGLDLWRGQIEPGRIAKVMVTAELPAEAADGQRVAVRVTAIGDATSLAGGMLLATPLRDEDGKIYTVGQGQVEVGNQVADVELSEQPGIAARVGVLAEGAILDSGHALEVAVE